MCLELSESDGVRGLSRFREGMANLNEPRRALLAKAGELHDLSRTVDLMSTIIADPTLRAAIKWNRP